MLDLYVMWQKGQRNSKQREKTVAVDVFGERYVSPGFWFPRSILSANQAIIRKMLCSYDIDMAMTTVPRLGFAEGMPSMEVVKLWQSLPNEGHPMLLSLKTLEWINFFFVFFVYLISDIFIHQNLAQIYTYYTLHWVTPGHRPKSSSKFPWKSQAASERSGIAKVDERGGSILIAV